jgi:membrane protease YdiL (CAAX protease family)
MNGEPIVDPKPPFFRRISPVAFATLALVGIFFLYQSVGNIVVLLLTGGKFTGETVSIVRWSTVAGQLLLMFLPTIILVRIRHGNIVRALRVRLPGTLEVILVVLATIALQQVAQGYMTLQDAIPVPEPLRRTVEIVRHAIEEAYRLVAQAEDPAEFLVVVLAVALVPAISEEFLFRGLVQQSLAEAAGGWRGAVIAGIIFGAYHLNPFSIVPLVALGIFFGYVVFRSGNLLLATIAHFVNNFVACAALYLRLPEDFILLQPDGGATPETVLMNALVSAAAFLLLMYGFVAITTPKESGPASL